MWALFCQSKNKEPYLFIYFIYLLLFRELNDHWTHNWSHRWISGIISDGKQMIHTVLPLVVNEEMNTYLTRGGHFEFYARWPPEIDHNLFAMVFETFTPIPNTMPNLKNLALSARFDLFLVYSCPAICLQHKIDLAAPVTWLSGPRCRKRHWDPEAPVHLCFHCLSFVLNRCGQLKQLFLWNETNDKQTGCEAVACAPRSARQIWSQRLFRLFLTRMSSSKSVEMSSYLPDLDLSSLILVERLWISDCLEKCLLPATCCTSLQSSPPNSEAVV